MTEDKNKPSFETAMTELETIVQKLEKGDLPLEESLEAFKKGIELSQYCQQSLNKAEAPVAKIMTEEGEALLDGDLT